MKRIKSYKFWVAVCGAVVVFGKTLAEALGCEFDTEAVNAVLLSFCGVMSAIGIIEKPNDSASKEQDPTAPNEKNDPEDE